MDCSPLAIQQAGHKGEHVPGVTFLEGDVTQLPQLGVQGPFDLVLDIGCFRGLPAQRRPDDAEEVASLTRPGALLLMWEVDAARIPIPGALSTQAGAIADRFGKAFRLERVETRPGRWTSRWYVVRRK